MRTCLIIGLLSLSACELTPDAEWEYTGASPYEGKFSGNVTERGGKPTDADIKLVLKTDVAFVEEAQTFKADFELKGDMNLTVGFLCGGSKKVKKQKWELVATVTPENKVFGSKEIEVEGNKVTVNFAGTFDQEVRNANLEINFDIANIACSDPALTGSFTRK